MSENDILKNPFIDIKNNAPSSNNKSNFTIFNILVSMNPNILELERKIPKCPICLGFIIKPVIINKCSHIFCKFCLEIAKKRKIVLCLEGK